ncbi:MAG: hypothetical protein ACRD2D_06415 [Terriglobales bacterium]
MDVERTMQFILETQAQHAVALQQHREALRDLDQRVATVTDLIGRLAQAQLQLVGEVRTLREVQAASDERMNALIRVVDDLVRRNGHGRQS